MDLVIIRHARPERIDGASSAGPADPALTEVGHQQAKAVADWLAEERIDAVYVSPMRRARETAAPIESVLGLTATVVGGVQEYDADEAAYIPMEEVQADKRAWKDFIDQQFSNDFGPFRQTVVAAIESIIGDHKGQTVAIVCHGGVVNAWAAETLGLADTMFFSPEYTSISRFRAASSGVRSVVTLNESAHLRAGGLHLTK